VIIYLEFSFIIAKIEMLLDHQHVEEDQQINSPQTSITFALLGITFFEQWSK